MPATKEATAQKIAARKQSPNVPSLKIVPAPVKAAPVKAAPRVAGPVKAAPVKAAPIVVPAVPTPEKISAQAALVSAEKSAKAALNTTIRDAEKVARALAALYPLKPWMHTTSGKAEDTDGAVKRYFQNLGMRPDNFSLPDGARRILVTLVYGLAADVTVTSKRDTKGVTYKAVEGIAPAAPVAHVAAMASAGERTIARDRDALGIANPNMQESRRNKPAAGDDSGEGDEDGSAPDAPAELTDKQVQQQVESIQARLDKITGRLSSDQADALITSINLARASA